jgi:hypothetical protein
MKHWLYLDIRLVILCAAFCGPANSISAEQNVEMKDVIRKAVNVKPSSRQLAWQKGEFIC